MYSSTWQTSKTAKVIRKTHCHCAMPPPPPQPATVRSLNTIFCVPNSPQALVTPCENSSQVSFQTLYDYDVHSLLRWCDLDMLSMFTIWSVKSYFDLSFYPVNTSRSRPWCILHTFWGWTPLPLAATSFNTSFFKASWVPPPSCICLIKKSLEKTWVPRRNSKIVVLANQLATATPSSAAPFAPSRPGIPRQIHENVVKLDQMSHVLHLPPPTQDVSHNQEYCITSLLGNP